MSTIAAKERAPSVFQRLTEVTEIRDEKGSVLGIYTPSGKSNADCHHILIAFDDGATVTFDMQQARERFEREKGQGRPLSEILDRLGSLEQGLEKKTNGQDGAANAAAMEQ